jgi:hypothetical protein
MNRRRFASTVSSTLLGLAVGAFALPACGPDVDAELPDFRITQKDVLLRGIRVETDFEATARQSFRISTSTGIPRDAYTEALVHEVVIEPKSGQTDLSFVRAVRLTMNTPEGQKSGAPGIEIGRYERPASGAPGPSIVIPATPPADVLTILRAPRALVEIEATGTVPAEDWTVDIVVKLSAKLSYD